MKDPLKINDPVAVYDRGVRIVGRVTDVGVDGHCNVYEDSVTPEGRLLIRLHPKQCRRLVRRKPREWTGAWAYAGKTHPKNIVFIPNGVVPLTPVPFEELNQGMTLVEKARKK